MTQVPTILYVDCNLRSGIDRRRLDGLRRYAATRKWRVETLEHGDCSAEALREALARLRPIGCAAECWPPKTALRPAAFGRVPVVYFEPLDEPEWRRAHGVTCDNAAVGRLAFEELSSTHPPAYAVVSCGRGRRWANERTDSFLDCCRKAGAACDVAHFPFERADEFDDCVGRMVPWVAFFPPLLVDRRKSTRGYGRREARILEAVEMIRREACDGLTAANLARRFPGTRQLFDLCFREAMGHSPLDEIIHVRLQRVLELLSQPDFPISAIADFCGFPSERVFQKHFRARFHTSMRDWRKARQG